MINVPFLLKIILQIIELLLGSDVFGDDVIAGLPQAS